MHPTTHSDSNSSNPIFSGSPERKLLDLEESSASENHSSDGFINPRFSSSNSDLYPSTPPAPNSRTFSYSSPTRSYPRSPPSHTSPLPHLSEKQHLRSMSTQSDSFSAFGQDEKGRRPQVQSYNSNMSGIYSHNNSNDGSKRSEISIFQGEEDDDWLHDSRSPSTSTRRGNVFSDGFPLRALLNIGTLFLLLCGILMLFAGYPLLQGLNIINNTDYYSHGSSNLGGTNASGQIPSLQELRLPSLIDSDTPDDVKSRTGFDGKKYSLVFSDEFNVDGRTFYPGDDPYWEAVDLWYWGTQNYEWYDPAAITTSDGALQITLSETPEHNKNFRGGMLQSWNKFCFTGGYIEASIRLPGYSDVRGMWPAFWLLGNLGRPGYGASLEGTWPYSYESCDVGVLPNQTHYDNTPATNARGGFVSFNRDYNTSSLSWAPGQKLSACTCDGEDHPGPKVNGKFKGRGAPEIDIFEAQTTFGNPEKMTVSQSAQFAPFNNLYQLTNTSGPAVVVEDFDVSNVNSYTGAAFQQAVSVVTETDQAATEKGLRGQAGTGGKFSTYGAEYHTGNDGDITFVSDSKITWKLTKDAMAAADPVSQISRRPIAPEPMSIILNLGMSQSFGEPEWNLIDLPSKMSVDYVRVYQPEDNINIGCDPPDYPTADYINRHPGAYNNAQLQYWGLDKSVGGYGANWPRQNLDGGCSVEAQNKPGILGKELPNAPYFAKDDLPAYS